MKKQIPFIDLPEGKRKRVLDIGAADNPDPKATHAIDDYIPHVYEKKLIKTGVHFIELPIGQVEKYPVLEHKFDEIVSHHAVGNIAGIDTPKMGDKIDYLAKKKKAKLIITTGDYNSQRKKIKAIFKRAKFKATSIKRNRQHTQVRIVGVRYK